MKDGYPEKHELDKIKNWDIIKDCKGLLDYIEDLWQWADIKYFDYEYPKLELHTGGWSGNESIIGALKENTLFWMCYWDMSRRGGHYYFDLSHIKNESITPDQ